MSFSKERQEYHLTPRGWIEGTFDGGLLGGGLKEVVPPDDRVLTVECYDEMSSSFSQPHFYDRVSWTSEDTDKVESLKKKFGSRPDWFGYKSSG